MAQPKFTPIVEHLVAMETENAPAPVDTEAVRRRIESQVRETIALLGMQHNPRNDEVFNPADFGPKITPDRQRGVRWSGSGRRR